MKIKEIVRYAENFIFPNRCIICDEVLSFGTGIYNTHICQKCVDELELINEPKCVKCGAAIMDDESHLCLRCKNTYFEKKSYYNYGFGLCRYNDSIKKSIHRIKYDYRKEYLEFYGKAIVKKYHDEIANMDIDCFVPVPIHKKRYIERNYNQSEVLAEHISEELKKYGIDIPINNDIIYRTKNTKSLNRFDTLGRVNELNNAFYVNKIKNINNICIVDDIYTTGSTIETMSKILYKNGYKNIYFISIAVVDNL